MGTDRRFPAWLRRPIRERVAAGATRRAVAGLHTVCEEARCPNRGVCFHEQKTATFLLLGPGCSRRCGFCSVTHGVAPVDPTEAERVANAVNVMGLTYVVITSTTRDDLPDGGASHFAAVVHAVKGRNPNCSVEVLTPDFGGAEESVRRIARAPVVVFGHNVETVPRLYPAVRPLASYERSLRVLAIAREEGVLTKSALMLGLGEDEEEVYEVLNDLRLVGVDIVAIGQYLRPDENKLVVAKYYPPAAFDRWGAEARSLGFAAVVAGPFVRSSFDASRLYDEARTAKALKI